MSKTLVSKYKSVFYTADEVEPGKVTLRCVPSLWLSLARMVTCCESGLSTTTGQSTS